MPSRRGGLGSAALNGTIHAFGGESCSGVFADHAVYDPVADQWIGAPALPTARHGLGVAAVGGKIYVIGGGPKPGLFVSDANESLRIS